MFSTAVENYLYIKNNELKYFLDIIYQNEGVGE